MPPEWEKSDFCDAIRILALEKKFKGRNLLHQLNVATIMLSIVWYFSDVQEYTFSQIYELI
jgi:hypothetical protein